MDKAMEYITNMRKAPIKYSLNNNSSQLKSSVLARILRDDKKHYYFVGESDNETIILTWREVQCMLCLVFGDTAKEAAQTLKLSYRSVEACISRIKRKLACKTKSQLIKKALECHFLEWVVCNQ